MRSHIMVGSYAEKIMQKIKNWAKFLKMGKYGWKRHSKHWK